MKGFVPLTIAVLSAIGLAGCQATPYDSVLTRPATMSNGQVVQPPPGGWPNYYDHGGESGGSGGRN